MVLPAVLASFLMPMPRYFPITLNAAGDYGRRLLRVKKSPFGESGAV
jgi:hypothetical protein